MKAFVITVLLVVSMLTGCSTRASRMYQIKQGMLRSEVIQALGKPVSTGLVEGNEVFYYKMAENFSDYSHSFWGGQPYYVKFKDGKVESYGRQGETK